MMKNRNQRSYKLGSPGVTHNSIMLGVGGLEVNQRLMHQSNTQEACTSGVDTQNCWHTGQTL